MSNTESGFELLQKLLKLGESWWILILPVVRQIAHLRSFGVASLGSDLSERMLIINDGTNVY